MHLFDPAVLQTAVVHFGYVVVFFAVALESAGLPLPGETVLVTAAIYAGSKHQLRLDAIVIVAAAAAIIGDNVGFWVGRSVGTRLVARFGPKIGFDERRQRLGEYLFQRYGGWIVFFGRFAALLRTYAALLAGINRLPPWRFFAFNAAGGVIWAALFGCGGYLLGTSLERITGPIGYVALACALGGGFFLWRFFKSHEERLLKEAEAASATRAMTRASARG